MGGLGHANFAYLGGVGVWNSGKPAYIILARSLILYQASKLGIWSKTKCCALIDIIYDIIDIYALILIPNNGYICSDTQYILCILWYLKVDI